MGNKIKWLFFDVGSTLVDEALAFEHCINTAIAGTAITYSEFYDTMLGYYKQSKKGDLEALRHYRLETPPWPLEMECLYPQAESCLKTLSQRYSIGIIANQSIGTESRLKAFGLLKYIRLVLSSAEEGVSKPDPQIFRLALERAGCKAQEALMVGDRLDNDVAPARGLGMKAVWIKQGFGRYATPQTKLEIPDYTVESLQELCSLSLE